MRFSSYLLLLSGSSSMILAQSTTTTATPPQSTACGDIVNSENVTFPASLAYECLTSVPFNAAVATRFLQYYNDTLQFQSTLAYLKNPPASYQQPAVDLVGGLQQLQQAIDNGIFSNQYEFEAAMQTLLISAHDSHLELFSGILAAFTFASPYDLVSVSVDGIQLPKVYFFDDLNQSSFFETYQPSAIASINGVDITAYLTEFASNNSIGTLEPHADWNQLFLSAAQDIQGYFNTFSGGATFYPGDALTFKLENGTEIASEYVALYNSPGDTGPLETGGDFYNFFVLGFYPASFNYTSDDETSAPTATASSTAAATSTVSASPSATTTGSWDYPAYPLHPDVAQPDLGIYGGGFISGYFLKSTSTSVLSIPSFDEYDEAINTFQSTIGEFLNKSQEAGLQKIVIDLQQNTGGQSLLAIDTFKQFFPNIEPFAGSRMRAHYTADVMGETMTDYWDSLNTTEDNYYILSTNEWVITDRLNAATNQNFTSWAEFYGPNLYNGDNFTNVQRYNLSSYIFDVEAVQDDVAFAVYGYAANPSPVNTVPPYAAEDIIILSDGICDSSCALFMEMMHHEAGVRVVVAGGRPSYGPMQAPSGSRGARDYITDELDADIDVVQQILAYWNNTTEVNFLPNRTEALDVYVTYADVNLRDQVRKGETIPLQFAYEAADCRIFYTPKTIYNYTALWQYAADAIWSNPSLCVQGSTGFATTGTNTTDFTGPSSNENGTSASNNLTEQLAQLSAMNTSSIHFLTGVDISLQDAGLHSRSSSASSGNSCTATSRANCKIDEICNNSICVKQCYSGPGTPCGGGGSCQPYKSVGNVGSQARQQGFCQPPTTKAPFKTGIVNVGPSANLQLLEETAPHIVKLL